MARVLNVARRKSLVSSKSHVSPRHPAEMLESRILLSKQVVWIEGESPAASTFVDYWLGANAQPAQLSNGSWNVHSMGGAAYSQYNFAVPEAGSYQLWLRLQTYLADYSYRIDAGATVPLSMTDVAAGSPIDYGYDGSGWSNAQVGWVYAGAVNLTAGNHSIRVNSTGNWGGIDAIGMTNYAWVPAGPFKPDPSVIPAANALFPFTAHPDDFSSSSVIDLSYLNEDTAGSKGALTRVGDHYEFANEPGVPVKFWGIDANPVSDPTNIAKQARWYAKNGINIVRLAHLDGFFDTSVRDVNGDFVFDAARMDQLDRFFAALKDNGIYMDWSMVWKFPIVAQDGYPAGLYNELVSANGGQSYGLVNFMPELQQIRWRFVSALLDHVNPYTGLRYADDPALAVVEVQNEDNAFFWSGLGTITGNTMPLHKQAFQQQWQQWVKAKYGTDAALQGAWGSGFRFFAGSGYDPDGVDSLNMRVYGPWELQATLHPWDAQEQARAGDFLQFVAEMQRNYYSSRMQQIRGAGFQGVTVSTNWMVGENVADAGSASPGGSSARAANLWADQAGDAIDKHDYWQGGDGDWRIVTTDTNGNAIPGEILGTMLKSPGQGLLQVGMYQVEDKPFNYSEWNDTPPNRYQAEAAPLVAFYGMGLQGWDASFQFASNNYYYNSGYESGGYLSFYNSDTPVYMGQFPALSLAVRRGDITQGGTAAARRISLDNAFSATDAFTQSLPNNGWGGGTGNINTPNAILAVGRVTANVGDGLGASQRENWGGYWNQSSRTILSDTGELFWDYNKGLIKVMAEQTQAIIGFAGPGTYDLPGFTVNVTTDYVDLIFTALDDKPLATSQNILVTALSRTKQYGTKFSSDGTQITEIGADPLLLQPVQATITMKDGTAQSVKVLDFYGVPTGQNVPLSGNTFTIDGRFASFYYQITREPVNTAPTLEDISDRTVAEGTELGFTAYAADADLPAQALIYSLGEGAPAGAAIDPVTGVFCWTPTEDQGPGVYSITIEVSDGALSDSKTFQVTVTEANSAPTLGNASFTLPEDAAVGSVLGTLTGSDSDAPANTLSYAITGGNADARFAIDAATGQITLIAPLNYEACSSYSLTITTTDNGSPALSASATVTITVTDVYDAAALVINGTDAANTIEISAANGQYTITHDGVVSTAWIGEVSSITILALGGNDTITVGSGVQACIIDGGAGDDLITAGDGADTIRGDDGNDTIAGGAGDDSIMGNFGDDQISGDDGNDLIQAGLGNDSIVGGLGDDDLYAGDGFDTIFGDAGNDYIEGRGKADSIDGGAGNDEIWGGAGNDTIKGGAGDDWIDIGYYSFSDLVYGGDGYDTVQRTPGDTNDLIDPDVESILG